MSWKNVQYENGKLKTSEGGGGGSSTFAGLDDVNFSDIQNGQVPKYNSETHKWENANESGGGGTVTDVQVDGVSVVNPQGVAEITMPAPPSVPSELSDLSDVQFSNLTDHQPLRYNATSQKWVNGADSYPPLIYSDNEREVGVWRDGKPLYQKVINVGSLPQTANTAKNVEHNISNIDTVCLLRGAVKNSSGTVLPLPYIAPDNLGYGIQLSATSTYIVLRTGTDRSAFSGYAIIQYTKTTDTAGSGTWTTQGTPTHHYSTTEQVIGTWIDGKPLYEKTYDFSNNPISLTSSWANTGQALSNCSCKNHIIIAQNGISYKGTEVLIDANNNYNIRARDVAGNTSRNIYYLVVQYTKTTD